MKSFVRTAVAMAATTMVGSLSTVSAQEIQAVPADQAAAPAYTSRLHDARLMHVMVMLKGDSVASVQARLGRSLTASERNGIISLRKAEHAGMRQLIEANGGKIHASLQSAMNALRIEIPRNRLSAVLRLPGVAGIKPVGNYVPLNATGVPLIGAPQVWQGLTGAQGQNIKIAILDTGIDYTHANFGGPGTVAAYASAKSTNTLPANPAWFGPGAPKVKGGIDLVGDAYTGSNTPVPDPNPLDCEYNSGNVGHGSHVAGTAAGFGVKADGSTFTGPYNAAAYTPGAFRIGPGVAPKADLYAVRVFGCSGSTRVVADAIDWAVANGMDVISMSLGSNWGEADNSESVAIANARAAGIMVVAASGNAGPTPYITSAPGSSPGALSVAATDAMAGIPMANLALSTGPSIQVQNSNSGVYASPTTWPVVVLRNGDGTVSLGCNPDEYDKTKNGGIDITGKLVVTVRGTCARVYRAGAAQHFGAAAAAMINSSAGLPPYEGPIAGGAATPNDGNTFEPVTIPFFGINSSDASKFASAGTSPSSATGTSAGIVANAGFEKVASFSSAGPRIGDSAIRPGVTAPGVATVSTASGTGNGFEVLSGTSMATPHIAGVAALVRQVNGSWSVDDQRAAIVQTANPAMSLDYATRFEGSGLVQVQSAVATQAVVRMDNESVGFGYADLLSNFSSTKQVTVHNFSPKVTQFNISVTKASGPAGATLTAPASLIVPGNGNAQFPLTLNVPADSMGTSTQFTDVGGYVQLTPSSSRLNGGQKLTVPFYMVGHSRSNLAVTRVGNTLNFTNAGGAKPATPTFYALGQVQPAPQGVDQADVRAVGARLSGTNVIFGVNTHNRTSTTLAFQEMDICIDTSGGPGFTPNFVLIGINGSAFGATAPQNTYTTALFPTDANCNINGGGSLLFTVTQPTDGSVLSIPVPRGGTGTSGLGLTAANPRFKYQVFYFGSDGFGAAMPGTGRFNAFTPALTFTAAPTVPVGGTGSATVTVTSEQANSPAAGIMIVAPDNTSGASQTLLLDVSPPV